MWKWIARLTAITMANVNLPGHVTAQVVCIRMASHHAARSAPVRSNRKPVFVQVVSTMPLKHRDRLKSSVQTIEHRKVPRKTHLVCQIHVTVKYPADLQCRLDNLYVRTTYKRKIASTAYCMGQACGAITNQPVGLLPHPLQEQKLFANANLADCIHIATPALKVPGRILIETTMLPGITILPA